MDDLQRVEQNDATLTEFWLTSATNYYSRLGASIGHNTHLTTLNVGSAGGIEWSREMKKRWNVADNGFIDGLKRNTSIHDLRIIHVDNIYLTGGLVHEILNVYKENNHLTGLSISYSSLQNGGDNVITETLR